MTNLIHNEEPSRSCDTPRDSVSFEDLGDQMKFYEGQTSAKLLPMLPTLARIDGRAFHTFTRGMSRPFDTRFQLCMQLTARALAEETNTRLCYTQSDEITLCWLADNFKAQIWFNNKHSKMVSNLASLATLHFNRAVEMIMPEYMFRNPTFDALVWQVPNREEACKVFAWREMDATRNSIASATSALIGHSRMQNKNRKEMMELLYAEAGVNWNDYPDSFKRGCYIQRVTEVRKFTTAEMEKLPPRHQAHANPDLTVERTAFRRVTAPPFRTIANQVGFVFSGEKPVRRTCEQQIQ